MTRHHETSYAPLPKSELFARCAGWLTAPATENAAMALSADALSVGTGAGQLSRRRCRWLHAFDRAEDDLAVFDIDNDRLAGVELLPKDLLRQRIFDHALDGTTQWSSAQGLVVALLDEHELRFVGELESEVLRFELSTNSPGQHVDDLSDLWLAELMEDDRVVDAVQELGTEVRLERLVRLLLHPLVADLCSALRESHTCLTQLGRTEVRSHDDDRVLEVDGATLTVG